MEKRDFFVGFLAIAMFVFSLNIVSAEIILSQSPDSIYNLGDSIALQAKITSASDAGETFRINLLCSGIETEIYKEFIGIPAGDEAVRKPAIPLVKSFVGNSIGTCRIKYSYGNEMKFTENFELSDKISVELSNEKNEFAPGDEMEISGSATKENGKAVSGMVNAVIINENSSNSASASETVKDGKFLLKMAAPKNLAAGKYLVRINVSEKDSKGDETNKGYANYNILISQVPTSLEIFLESKSVAPGETLRTKAVLHDQTGVQISSSADIVVKTSLGKIIERKNISTNEFLELLIPENEKPAEWKIIASSGGLQREQSFTIKPLEKISFQIVNSMLTVTNTGNVQYNKTVLVKVGENPLNIDVDLDVGKSSKYFLSAPDGEYKIELIGEGIPETSQSVPLTGKVIDIRETGMIIGFVSNPLVWIFVILVLAGVGAVLYRRRNNRSFFGYPQSSSHEKKLQTKSFAEIKKDDYAQSDSKAELSLSVKGNKQTASMVCLRIKNFDTLKASRTNYGEVIKGVVREAEGKKASVYENSGSFFFIFFPLKTKTFKNERAALNLAKEISDAINVYNKLAREKINFGISVSNGEIIAGIEKGTVKFMSLGNFINSAKKLSSLSEGELLINEEARNKLGAEVKTQRRELSGTIAYAVNEVRDDERSKEFIRRFMQRMEK